ncbi:MAG: Arm DNA-binding domain-containing protein [Gammaproteobacteria bacterium]
MTEATIRSAKPGDKPRKLSDAGGLYLLLNPNGSRWWRLKYYFGGKQKGLSLGVYPDVDLKQARQKRDEFRTLLSNGIDPSEHRKAERQADREARERQTAAMRFFLGNDGALSIKLGTRRVDLTPAETADLRTFLDATSAVAVRSKPCR